MKHPDAAATPPVRRSAGDRKPVGVVLAVLALIAIGCGRRETQADQAVRDNILLIGNGAEPSDLDPQTITGIPERDIVITLFEGLTRLEPATLEPIPGIADRWDISPDQLVYTFHLRRNAAWSDGTPLTAHDFYAAFRRMLAPELGSENADNLYHVINAEEFHLGRLKDFTPVGFRVVDDHTLQMRLRYPAPFLLRTIAQRSWFPIPRHVIGRFGDMHRPGNRWSRLGNLVGNGPYVLHEWRPNVHIDVRRSATYWNRDAVRLAGIRFFPIENETAEEAAFRAGQMHRTNRVPIVKIPVYQREAPDLLHIHPQSGVYFYNLNVNRPPLDDVRVRRALAMAIDRPRIVQFVSRAGEKPAYHFVPEGISGYENVTKVPFDFDAARRLLAEAGYPGGRGLEPITLLYNTAENHRAIAEALQQTWKRELGIDLRLENQEWKVYLDTQSSQQYQISRAGLIIEPFDASFFLRVMTSGDGFNRTGWSNSEYDGLYERLMREADPNRRVTLIQRMEAILLEDMPIIPVYFYTNQYLLDRRVHGTHDNLLALDTYDRAWVE